MPPIAVHVVLGAEKRDQLESWTRRGKSAQALAVRARIVLAAAEGLKNTEIAERLSVDHATVRKWRGRFARDRLEGLLDEPRLGRPRTAATECISTHRDLSVIAGPNLCRLCALAVGADGHR